MQIGRVLCGNGRKSLATESLCTVRFHSAFKVDKFAGDAFIKHVLHERDITLFPLLYNSEGNDRFSSCGKTPASHETLDVPQTVHSVVQ